MQFKRYQALLVCFIGLRTLCIATTEISEELYDEWKHTYYKASTSIQNRDKKLEEALMKYITHNVKWPPSLILSIAQYFCY
jgi:hypothetical protein